MHKHQTRKLCFLIVLPLRPKSLPLGLPERKEQRKTVNFLISRWFPGCGHPQDIY